MKTLKDLFWDELMDIYDAEHQLVKALPKLAAAATCKHLNQALLAPLQQTEGHITQIEAVFTTLGETANGNTCEATQGMLEEGDGIIAEYQGSPAINAALICAAQKVEHYEIATYGCLHEWAGLLGHHEDDSHSKIRLTIMNTRFKPQRNQGKIGWALLWLVGVPLPLLLVFYFLRGCT